MPHIHHSTCPVCFSAAIQFCTRVQDHAVTKEWFELWSCADCKALFTQDIPDPSTIAAYYHSENYISHTDTRKGLLFKAYHAARWLALRRKYLLIRKAFHTYVPTWEMHALQTQPSVLDIGCGTGSFLHMMQRHGWQVTGIEPSETARNIAKKKYQLDVQDPIQLNTFPDQHFTLITLWHVLEHIHALHENLSTIYRLLHPYGLVFIAVPNYTSFDERFFGNYWAAYDVPRHLYHFAPQTMQLLLVSHRFELVKILPMRMDAFYIAWLSSQYARQRLPFAYGMMTGFISWLLSQHHPMQSSSLLYIARKYGAD
ncbi:class I SAM-dependent methyltransferase [Thermoflavifilum thermophilum]|uniref:Methyltransferase domain-containing protein n=1 Tax=Thermoflavifilum thermophilum TaxID=1393122 RepID=A0A1I7MZ70_9BACT|nr:class I SAM-dependent methyltransferase [Thermoflavifilum thermophilum]SFV27713.1 Methyltransferase domain-containing protein [Thermoflavifilum thermophilum]